MGLLGKWLHKSELSREQPLYACVQGDVMPLASVSDEAFASGALGKGVGIIPQGSLITAPLAGEITMLFPTLHAIGIKGTAGIELLIHIGINTVELEGKGFLSKCKQGQAIRLGEPLIEVDFAHIKKAQLDPTVMMVVTNSGDYTAVECLYGEKTSEDIVMEVRK